MQVKSLSSTYLVNMVMGVGIDTEAVKSFSEKPYAEHKKFYERIFSTAEIEYCLKRRDPYMHFAGKFCAKEALIKAGESVGKFFLSDFQIISGENTSPKVLSWGSESRADAFLQTYDVKISVSHTTDHAVAFALVQQKG